MAKPIDQIGQNELHPTLKALAKAGGTTEHADWISSGDNAARLISFIDDQRETLKNGLIHGLFTKPHAQIARMREWNREFGWGIPEGDFAAAEKSVPAWPKEKLVAVVLVPDLPANPNEDGTVTYGFERTFHELWARASAEQDAGWRYDNAGPVRLGLLKGIEHNPGIRWEVIDLGCQRYCKPCDVRHPDRSPHAGILAAAALHPEWIKAMDGTNVPYVFAPGYVARTPDDRLGFDIHVIRQPESEEWRGVPFVNFNRYDRVLRLLDIEDDFHGSDWAVPSFFRE